MSYVGKTQKVPLSHHKPIVCIKCCSYFVHNLIHVTIRQSFFVRLKYNPECVRDFPFLPEFIKKPYADEQFPRFICDDLAHRLTRESFWHKHCYITKHRWEIGNGTVSRFYF